MLAYVITAAFGAGAGYALGLHHGKNAPKSLLQSAAATPLLAASPAAAAANPAATAVSFGTVTPERNEFCRQLLAKEHRPDILDKLAQLFANQGLQNHGAALSEKANRVRQQARVAGELVERSRLGDQQAWGLIETLAIDAKAGSIPAVVSCELMQDYIKAHPPPAGMPNVMTRVAT